MPSFRAWHARYISISPSPCTLSPARHSLCPAILLIATRFLARSPPSPLAAVHSVLSQSQPSSNVPAYDVPLVSGFRFPSIRVQRLSEHASVEKAIYETRKSANEIYGNGCDRIGKQQKNKSCMQNVCRMGWDVVGNVMESNASIMGGVEMGVMKSKIGGSENHEIH